MQEKSITKNAILNVIRITCKVLFPIITLPYLTRVLTSVNYGKVNYCLSIVNYFVLFAGLGISTYIIREGSIIRSDKQKLNNFISEVFTINIFSTIISYIVFFLFVYLWTETIDYKILLIIQSSVIGCTTIGVEWLFSIFENYFYITIRSLAIQVAEIICIFFLVRNVDDYIVYAIIVSASTCIGHIINYYFSKKYLNIKLTLHTNLKKHIVPIIVLFANTALISIYLNSDITMLGAIKGDSEAGIYKVSVSVYNIIKQLLNAITIVFIPRFAILVSKHKEDEFKRLCKNALNILVMLLFPAIVGTIMMSNNIILIVGGEEYISGTSALIVLSIALMFAVVANLIVNGVLIIHKKENKVLITTIISSVTNVLLNIFFIPRFGVTGAAITTLIAEILVLALSLIFAKEFFIIKFDLRVLIKVTIGCIVIVLICLMIDKFDLSLTLDSIVKLILSFATYCIIMFSEIKKIRKISY